MEARCQSECYLSFNLTADLLPFISPFRFNYNCWLDSFKHCDQVKKELVELGYEVPEEENDGLITNN